MTGYIYFHSLFLQLDFAFPSYRLCAIFEVYTAIFLNVFLELSVPNSNILWVKRLPDTFKDTACPWRKIHGGTDPKVKPYVYVVS